MKNILGKDKNLELFNDKGKKVYEYIRAFCGMWYEYTYDDKGNELTYKNSDGYWYQFTYDEKGNELTYKNSDGVTIGFDIPEYTMEELVNKIGNFKIKK